MGYLIAVAVVLVGGLVALWLVPVKYEKYVLGGWAVVLSTLVISVAFYPWRMARVVQDIHYLF